MLLLPGEGRFMLWIMIRRRYIRLDDRNVFCLPQTPADLAEDDEVRQLLLVAEDKVRSFYVP